MTKISASTAHVAWPILPANYGLRAIGVASLLALLTACPSNPPVAKNTPAPPAPPAPTASIEATPSTIQAGQTATLSWKTANATDVAIAQVGAVQPNGAQLVTPAESITYHLTAKGPGGTREADARVTVTAAATSADIPPQPSDASAADNANRLDVFFDLDAYDIRQDQLTTIASDVQFLKEHPEMRIVVEGHCDELGSTEYNLALGDRRANEVRLALEKAGIPSARIRTVSYGKELPICSDQTENCWRMNRRAHITPDIQR